MRHILHDIGVAIENWPVDQDAHGICPDIHLNLKYSRDRRESNFDAVWVWALEGFWHLLVPLKDL
jgi:hypothetical protein